MWLDLVFCIFSFIEMSYGCCRKWHFRDPKFQDFLRGGRTCSQSPLVWSVCGLDTSLVCVPLQNVTLRPCFLDVRKDWRLIWMAGLPSLAKFITFVLSFCCFFKREIKSFWRKRGRDEKKKNRQREIGKNLPMKIEAALFSTCWISSPWNIQWNDHHRHYFYHYHYYYYYCYNNTHVKITRFRLAESSAVKV